MLLLRSLLTAFALSCVSLPAFAQTPSPIPVQWIAPSSCNCDIINFENGAKYAVSFVPNPQVGFVQVDLYENCQGTSFGTEVLAIGSIDASSGSFQVHIGTSLSTTTYYCFVLNTSTILYESPAFFVLTGTSPGFQTTSSTSGGFVPAPSPSQTPSIQTALPSATPTSSSAPSSSSGLSAGAIGGIAAAGGVVLIGFAFLLGCWIRRGSSASKGAPAQAAAFTPPPPPSFPPSPSPYGNQYFPQQAPPPDGIYSAYPGVPSPSAYPGVPSPSAYPGVPSPSAYPGVPSPSAWPVDPYQGQSYPQTQSPYGGYSNIQMPPKQPTGAYQPTGSYQPAESMSEDEISSVRPLSQPPPMYPASPQFQNHVLKPYADSGTSDAEPR